MRQYDTPHTSLFSSYFSSFASLTELFFSLFGFTTFTCSVITRVLLIVCSIWRTLWFALRSCPWLSCMWRYGAVVLSSSKCCYLWLGRRALLGWLLWLWLWCWHKFVLIFYRSYFKFVNLSYNAIISSLYTHTPLRSPVDETGKPTFFAPPSTKSEEGRFRSCLYMLWWLHVDDLVL